MQFSRKMQAFNSNNMTTQKSTFADHLLDTNHTYKNINENFTLFDFESKGEKLNTKEEVHIHTELPAS